MCAAALLTASVLAGCSTSYQLGSISGKNDDKATQTGGIGAPPRSGASEVALPPDSDLAFARVAASQVLSRGGKDASEPWENPRSGAHGTVTPLADAYRMEGALCRDFLASYIAGGAESWLQGEACREAKGTWEVRRLKPWRRT